MAYVALAAARLGMALIPLGGYVHPDEFFQSVERFAGTEFGVHTLGTWDWEGEDGRCVDLKWEANLRWEFSAMSMQIRRCSGFAGYKRQLQSMVYISYALKALLELSAGIYIRCSPEYYIGP